MGCRKPIPFQTAMAGHRFFFLYDCGDDDDDDDDDDDHDEDNEDEFGPISESYGRPQVSFPTKQIEE